MRFHFVRLLATVVGIGTFLFASPAFATDTTPAVPDEVFFANQYSDFRIQIGSSVYYSPTTNVNSGCSGYVNSLDSNKMWHGMAMAALLAGRKIKIAYTDCGGLHYIMNVTLYRN